MWKNVKKVLILSIQMEKYIFKKLCNLTNKSLNCLPSAIYTNILQIAIS